ncbi:hypothetical protein CYMTET_24415 [Cymbomonas tetramitiformis]|uniref:Uncharacterized protein n=1 Tax=Cymbomonas tetramitiformis TaxID=36881 RepID=A0AAE0FVX5_9CHLO|nr:hypothetical protein CYMTET_24415 [Cymbomonas tetramitiformis]
MELLATLLLKIVVCIEADEPQATSCIQEGPPPPGPPVSALGCAKHGCRNGSAPKPMQTLMPSPPGGGGAVIAMKHPSAAPAGHLPQRSATHLRHSINQPPRARCDKGCDKAASLPEARRQKAEAASLPEARRQKAEAASLPEARRQKAEAASLPEARRQKAEAATPEARRQKAEAASLPEARRQKAEAASLPEARRQKAEAASLPEARRQKAEAASLPEARRQKAEAASLPEARRQKAEAASLPEARRQKAEGGFIEGPDRCCKEEITSPMAERDLLMLCASLSRSPAPGAPQR